MEFWVEFSSDAFKHLHELRKRDQQIVVDAIVLHLSRDPDKPTRNRKRLADNPLAPWELRVRDFRVFYDIDTDAATVIVVAVGQKVHNRLFVGGQEIQL